MCNNEQNSQYVEPKISTLDAAKRKPKSVTRDTPLIDAITIMLVNNFSQLPVMQNDRTVHGMISWKSIGKRYGCQCRFVRDCMEGVEEIAILDHETPLIQAVRIISTSEFILVKARDNRIVGLVTATDITEQFSFLAEPYFLIGAIEQYLRDLISQRLPPEVIVTALCSNDNAQKEIGVDDMTFGDYICLLGKENNWDNLELNLSRKVFLNRLEKVREIRNHVMHFRGAPVSDEEIKVLRNFLDVLRNSKPFKFNQKNSEIE